MSHAVIFAGPSLSAAEVPPELEARVLPPAAQGDLLRAARGRPWAIGLVDGVFERCPSVWHKEVLWALSQGVHVFGAASMGALRAAELASFGMVGVGGIFEAFKAGALEDDDEVAVAHLGPADGHRASSTAMVEFRATLASARAQGLLSDATEARLLGLAKARFYPLRSWATLFRDADDDEVTEDELQTLRAWLPGGRVDPKRADALAMLQAMLALKRAHPEPFRPRWHFERTVSWEAALQQPGRAHLEEGPSVDAVAEELRLAGPKVWDRVLRDAALRALALSEAERSDPSPSAPRAQAALDALRVARGLRDPEEARRWFAERGFDAASLQGWAKGQAQLQRALDRGLQEGRALLRDELLASARADLLRRALDKQARLAEAGWSAPAAEDLGVDPEALLADFAAQHGAADLDALARRLGLEDRALLLGPLLRELAYRRLLDSGQ